MSGYHQEIIHYWSIAGDATLKPPRTHHSIQLSNAHPILTTSTQVTSHTAITSGNHKRRNEDVTSQRSNTRPPPPPTHQTPPQPWPKATALAITATTQVVSSQTSTPPSARPTTGAAKPSITLMMGGCLSRPERESGRGRQTKSRAV